MGFLEIWMCYTGQISKKSTSASQRKAKHFSIASQSMIKCNPSSLSPFSFFVIFSSFILSHPTFILSYSLPKNYHVIGPFPSLPGEVAADPLRAFFPDLHHYLQYAGQHQQRNLRHSFPSEIVDGGMVEWFGDSTEDTGDPTAAAESLVQVDTTTGTLQVSFPYTISMAEDYAENLGFTALMTRGWAVGNFSVPQDGVYLLDCRKLFTLYIFQYPIRDSNAAHTTCVCDPYSDGYTYHRILCSLTLEANSTYQIHVPLHGYTNGTSPVVLNFINDYEKETSYLHPKNLKARSTLLVPAPKNTVTATEAGTTPASGSAQDPSFSILPNIVLYSGVAYLAGSFFTFSALNPSSVDILIRGSASIQMDTDQNPKLNLDLEDIPLPDFPPGQIIPLKFKFKQDQFPWQSELCPLNFTVTLSYTSKLSAQKVQLDLHGSLKCVHWNRSESSSIATGYKFTFEDFDGSVQYAAVIPPYRPCTDIAQVQIQRCTSTRKNNDIDESLTRDDSTTTKHPDKCPVLVSFHGAGVEAGGEGWLHAYLRQEAAWVILVTNRDPYGFNYHGPGMKSGLQSLQILADLAPGVPTEEREAGFDKIDPQRLFFSGHSMGGHGCLLFITHYPDFAMGAECASGWLRLTQYEISATRIETSFADWKFQGLAEASIMEYYADLYVENMLGVPFIGRIGTLDDNVPPWNMRRFNRVLQSLEASNPSIPQSHVQYQEFAKEHHSLAVDDKNVSQRFIDQCLYAPKKPDLPHIFTVFTVNPASGSQRGGLRITQLVIPFQSARLYVDRGLRNSKHSNTQAKVHVHVNTESNVWFIKTENVAQFSFQAVSGMTELDSVKTFCIDDFSSKSNCLPVKYDATYCRMTSGARTSAAAGQKWSSDCQEKAKSKFSVPSSMSRLERTPSTSGPSYQIMNGALTFIHPFPEMVLYKEAVRICNLLYYIGKYLCKIVSDDENPQDYLDSNWIIMGGPRRNRWASTLKDRNEIADVRFVSGESDDYDGFCIGERCFDRGSSLMFLAGRSDQHLSLVFVGTSREALKNALDLLPVGTFTMMPEWIIISEKNGWGYKGIGGAVGLGYWDHDWRYLDAASAWTVFQSSDGGFKQETGDGSSKDVNAMHILTGFLSGILMTLITVGMIVHIVRRKRKSAGELMHVDSGEERIELLE